VLKKANPPASISAQGSQGARPSLKDIARMAGAGKATVSLALRNDPRLRPETRARIQEIAARAGYRVKPAAAVLMRLRRSMKPVPVRATWAYLDGSSVGNEDFAPGVPPITVKAMADRALQLGFTLDRLHLRDPRIRPRRLIDIIRARGIVGLVLGNLSGFEAVDSEFSPLWEAIPGVILGVRSSWPPMGCVGSDVYSTVLRAVRRIRGLGYRRPGLVIDASVDRLFEHRYSAAFKAACRRPLIPVPIHLSSSVNPAAFTKWFGDHQPDVILTCETDIRWWLGGLQINAPEDVGLVHLDIGPSTDDWTGMDQNHAQVGTMAAEILAERIERNERGLPEIPAAFLIEATWVEGSTTRLRASSGAGQPRANRTPEDASTCVM
jgi:LacI family transcriptional regulator